MNTAQLERTFGSSALPTKHYSGNPITDDPEYEEHSKTTMTMHAFLRGPPDHAQIKFVVSSTSTLLGDSRIYALCTSALNRLASAGTTAHIPKGAARNHIFRVSGPEWKFPSHFDCVDQLVMILHGTKRWVIDNKYTVTTTAGDVLLIKAGVWHSARNVGGECCAMFNFQWESPDTPHLTESFDAMYPLRVKRIIEGSDIRM